MELQVVIHVTPGPNGQVGVNMGTNFGEDAGRLLAVLELAKNLVVQQVVQGMAQGGPSIMIARGLLPGGAG